MSRSDPATGNRKPKRSAAVASVDGSNQEQKASKKVRLNVAEKDQPNEAVVVSASVVTPAADRRREPVESQAKSVRQNLFGKTDTRVVPITPSKKPEEEIEEEPKARRKLIFGRWVSETDVSDNVRKVYNIIRKLTGSIGGNASHGPIYGELTMGSMQKMVNLMKEHTGFDSSSRFIDVGSGIGKPNLHVAQDPGVEFSYGIEVETDRWLLGLNCLKGVLDAAYEQMTSASEAEKIGHHCVFERGDIREAKVFDPFTHVYMFSIGFPPALWVDLAEIWNRSSSPYLICYHSPRDIIKSYEFNVELVTQTGTSMHGSKEGHMAYIYRRIPFKPMDPQACDPRFVAPWEKAKSGLESLREEVNASVEEMMSEGPSTRASRRRESR